MTQKESHWHTGYRCRQYTDWPNKRPKPEVWICGSAKEGASVYWGRTLQNRSVPDVQAKREQWSGFAKTTQASHLVFLDERGPLFASIQSGFESD